MQFYAMKPVEAAQLAALEPQRYGAVGVGGQDVGQRGRALHLGAVHVQLHPHTHRQLVDQLQRLNTPRLHTHLTKVHEQRT